MIKSVVSVAWTSVKFLIYKITFGKNFIYGKLQRFSPNTSIELDQGSRLCLGDKVRVHSGSKIRVRKNAVVHIGDDVAFSYNCIITARKEITIGDGCEIAPGVLIYDHDHEYRSASIHDELYRCSKVTIGKNVWIGANAIILRGAEIGDGCVVAAGTVVRKGLYPPYSLICGTEKVQTKPIVREERKDETN